jgi:hypothetical protein
MYSNKSSEVGKYNINATSTKWVALGERRNVWKLFTKYHVGLGRPFVLVRLGVKLASPLTSLTPLSPNVAVRGTA